MTHQAQKKILLVEDEAIIAMAESQTIQHFGYDVLTANSGEKAVERATGETEIDLILMDIDLGKGINGPEAATQILKNRSIPIVFLTSHSEREMVEKIRGITRYGYVIKNSGDFVLQSSIEMAFELFDAHEKLTRELLERKSAEEKSRGLANIVESSLNEVYVFNTESLHFCFANTSALNNLGFSQEEITALTPVDIKPEFTRESFLRTINPLLTGRQKILHFETIHQRKDGSTYPVEIHLQLSEFDGKKVFSAIMLDVTERRQTEKALEESEDRLQLHTQNSPMGVIEWDADFVVTRWTGSAEKIFGWSATETIGKRLLDLHIVYEEDAVLVQNNMQTLASGSTRQVIARNRNYTKEGAVIQCEWYNSVLHDSSGAMLSVMSHVLDLTEQIQREEENRTILRTALDGFMVLDTEGQFLDVNDAYCRLIGYRREELLHMRLLDLEASEDAKGIAMHMQRIMQAGEDRFESRHRCKDGTVVDLEVSTNYMSIHDGRFVVFVRDITKRKETEEELKKTLSLVETTLESIDNGILVVDPEGAVLRTNAKFVRMWNIPEEILASDEENRLKYVVEQLVDPEVLAKKIKQLYNDPFAESFDVLHFKDGRVYERISRPLLVSGTPNGRVWSFHDVSEQVRVESQRAAALDALQKSEEKYRTYVDLSPMALFIVDAAGNYLDVNTAACSMLGYTRGELLTLSIRDLGALSDGKTVSPDFLQLKAAGQLRSETLLSKKNGDVIAVSLRAVGLPNGTYMALCGDITERKRLEDTIRESECFLDNLLDTIPLPVFYKNTQGKYLGMNKAFVSFFGKTKEQIIGRDIFEIYPPAFAAIYDAKDKEHYQKGGSQVYESIFASADGTNHNVVMHKALFTNRKGAIAGIIGAIIDVTERKAFEEAIQKQKDEFETIFNLVPAQIWYKDTQNRFIRVNRQVCTELGMTNADIEGHSAEELFPAFAKQYYEDDLEVFNTRTPKLGISEQINTASGEIRWVHTDKIPVSNADGTLLGLVAFAQDVTERRETEEALRNSERYSREIFNSTTEAIVIFDPAAGKLLDVNNAMVTMYGYSSKEEVLSLALGDFTISVDAFTKKSARDPGTKTIADGPQTLEWRARRKDGSEFWIEMILRSISSGGESLVLATGRDITERKTAEITIIQSERKFRSLFENAADPILLVALDGRILESNPATSNILGYSSGEIAAMKTIELNTEEYRQRVKERFDHIAKEGSHYFETCHYAKNGSRLYFEINSKLIDYEGGKAILSVYRDISAKKIAEKALLQSGEQLRLMVQDMQVGVLLQGPKAEILLSNPKALELLGLTEEQLRGKTSFDPDWHVIHEDGSPFPGSTHPVPRAIASGTSVRKVIMGVYRPVTGDRVWLLVDAEPQLNDDHTVKHVVCTFIDITERKNAEKTIQDLLHEKELLLKEVHHRIKNNMYTVMSLLALQIERLVDPSAIAALRDTKSRMNSMMVLYDKLYRSEGYRAMSVKSYFTQLVKEIVSNFPNSGSIAVTMDIDEFMLESKKLSALGILMNELLTNIMKHAFTDREHGVIVVSAVKKDDRVSLSVQDDGVGIPGSFDFVTSESFGLQLVDMLAKQLEGKIRVEREKGTKFVLEFRV